MKQLQSKQARKDCANFYHGDCIQSDRACIPMNTDETVCPHLKRAVVPAHPEAQAIFSQTEKKHKNSRTCLSCGMTFIPSSNRQTYCEGCGEKRRRQLHVQRQTAYRRKGGIR